MKELIDKLHHTQELTREEFLTLLSNRNTETDLYARRLARGVRQKIYGDQVYIRGLIEFTSYCRNDCYYCGLRRSNHAAQRYRLTEEDILSCCQQGYELGFRTFVLQGGEDGYFTGERLAGLVRHFPWGNERRKSTEHSGRPEQTVIFFVMKLQTRRITGFCIRNLYLFSTGRTVSERLKSWDFRQEQDLWWGLRDRRQRHWQRIFCF